MVSSLLLGLVRWKRNGASEGEIYWVETKGRGVAGGWRDLNPRLLRTEISDGWA